MAKRSSLIDQNSDSEAKNYVAIATRYAEQVVAGEIPACRWVRAACQRQLDDLQRADWRWTFDERRANRVCRFLELLPHIKGRWKTGTLHLEPWQCFALTTIFGWIDAEGLRRFRKALIVIPRKNGKTFIAAGVGLYLLAVDGEPGAEVVSAATSRDQAKLSWEVAKRIVERTGDFRARFGVAARAHAITVESEAASFKPLSRDADTLEGLNPHGWIVDELHAHKTREVFDVLDEATGARRQPLGFIISTEGDNATGVFAEQVAYGQEVLAKNHEDDSYFFVYYSIDVEDDWTAPASWRKANPNLGVSVFESDLEVRCRQAQKNAASQASFLTKRLNIRVGAGEAYFNMLAWDRLCCDRTLGPEDFYGSECWVTIDLASKIDIAAKLRTFEKDGVLYFFGDYYLPEDQLEKGNPNFDFYRGWAKEGFLTLTPGNIIDYGFIEESLLEDARNFDLRQVGIDPHNATQFNTRMQAEGLPIEEIQQSVPSLSDPMKELAARIIAGRVRHDGNPVLAWMIGNVVAKVDAKENVYPRKARPENKIDGAVTAIMGTKLVMLTQDSSVGVRAIG